MRSDAELTLRVFNDAGLYRMRSNSQLPGLLRDLFIFTDAQLADLEESCIEDARENGEPRPSWAEPYQQPDCDICSACGEHAEFDEAGSNCCGARAYDTDYEPADPD